MDKEAVEKYSSMMPSEIRCLLKPLSSDENWALFIYVLKNGDEKEIYLADMAKDFNCATGDIKTKIKPMVTSGLISQRLKLCDIGDFEKAIYSPTYMGKTLVRSLFENLI